MCKFIFYAQMYKVYRDPQGKSVMPTQQNMTTNFTFQCSEEAYKEQIEKLREENIYLKNKVSYPDTYIHCTYVLCIPLCMHVRT